MPPDGLVDVEPACDGVLALGQQVRQLGDVGNEALKVARRPVRDESVAQRAAVEVVAVLLVVVRRRRVARRRSGGGCGCAGGGGVWG